MTLNVGSEYELETKITCEMIPLLFIQIDSPFDY